MIQFGIPSNEKKSPIVDKYEGQELLIINAVKEGEKTKKKMSFSIEAARKLNVIPGISKVALSFDGGNFIAVVDNVDGVLDKYKYQVNKELSFFNKNAYEYLVKLFSFDPQKDNILRIETTTYEHIIIGELKLVESSTESEEIKLEIID